MVARIVGEMMVPRLKLTLCGNGRLKEMDVFFLVVSGMNLVCVFVWFFFRSTDLSDLKCDDLIF